jgi:hypothetical protein
MPKIRLAHRLFNVAFLSLLFVNHAHAQSTLSSGRSCNGTYTGTFTGAVTISSDQTCTFRGGMIDGTVTITGGRFFLLGGATVTGSIQIYGGRLILTDATVGRNVQINGPSRFSLGPSVSIHGNVDIGDVSATSSPNQICGTTVSGNFNYQNNAAALELGAASFCAGNTFSRNVGIAKNSARTVLVANTIGGNGQVDNNNGAITIVGNTVTGNFEVLANTDATILVGNAIGENLTCGSDPRITGGSNVSRQNSGCPTDRQVQAIATADGTNITFRSPTGSIALTIPLINQAIVTPTPDGDVTAVTHEHAIISEDGSHAGIVSAVFSGTPSEDEPLVAATFRYFDASGQLWRLAAPLGNAFYSPFNSQGGLLAADGSRVLIVSIDDGASDPAIRVFDRAGSILYQSLRRFDLLSRAQLSSNGRYLLVMGILMDSEAGVVRVTDLDSGTSTDVPFDAAAAGVPSIALTGDGHFSISYQGTTTVLPQP